MKKILLGMAIFSFAYPLRWEFEKVPKKIGGIVMDTSDIPHTVFVDRSVLCHGMRKDTGWWFEGVDTVSLSGASFGLAYGIYPCIAYIVSVRERIQWGPKYLKYARWDGREWNIQVVDSVDRVQVGPRTPVFLDFDRKNYPHIIYMQRYRIYNPDSSWTTYVRVRYAKWNGDGWEFTTLDSTNSNWDNGFTVPSAMKLDNEGHPHIAGEYSHCAAWGTVNCTTAVVHLYEDDIGWHTDTLCDTIVPDAWYDPYSSITITIDPYGRPIIFFDDWKDGQMAIKEEDSWQLQTIERRGFKHISSRWDKEGRLHIAYGCENYIIYRVWDGDTWMTDTVYVAPQDSTIEGGHCLALDSKGYPHIVISGSGWSYYVRGLPEEGVEGLREGVKCPELIASPNPARGMVDVRYEIRDKGSVSIQVYNAIGRLVRTLVTAQNQKPGTYKLRWNGRDDKGEPLPSGVYWLMLEQENKRVTRQLIKIE